MTVVAKVNLAKLSIMSETKECDEDLATDVVNASLSTTIDRDQALVLREAIIDLSQRCWAAYWMYDCEYALWTFSGGGTSEPKQTKWGIGGVSVEDGTRLQDLAKACGGWWMWQSGKRGSTEVFVPMARWLELVKARGTAIATEVHAEDESLQHEAWGEEAGRVLDMARTSRSLVGNIGRDLEAFGFSVVSGPFGFNAPPTAEIVIEYDLVDGDAPATFRILSSARTISMTVPELHAAYVRLYDLGAGATKDDLLAALGAST
jgi:hypothetical protein